MMTTITNSGTIYQQSIILMFEVGRMKKKETEMVGIGRMGMEVPEIGPIGRMRKKENVSYLKVFFSFSFSVVSYC